mgnify:CR=1 FL=1
MSQSTTREARIQLILMLIAIAVGGVVFVLADAGRQTTPW